MRSARAKWSDLVVGVVLVLLLGTFATAQFNRARETANRVKCASNLRQIGQAILLYSNDNRGSYPRTITDVVFKQVGAAPLPPDVNPVPTWGTPYEGNDKLKPDRDEKKVDPFSPTKSKHCPKPNDVTAAMFLLLRTQDITSEVFTCPSTGMEKFDYGGGTLSPLNVTNWLGKASLADHLSYSMQNPYVSRATVKKGFKWNNTLGAEVAIAADMNPGVDALLTVNVTSAAADMQKVNSRNHDSDGQNILYGDGHVAWESNPFVGVNRDNIYTFGPSGMDAKEKGGDGIVGAAVGPNDSVLLPTAKDLGVIGADGALTAAAKERRAKMAEAMAEAMRPATPAEQDASRKMLMGTYTRGGNTLKISEDKLELIGAKAMTFNLKLAGIDRKQAQLKLTTADDPFETKAELRVMIHPDGIGITGPPELDGAWKRQ